MPYIGTEITLTFDYTENVHSQFERLVEKRFYAPVHEDEQYAHAAGLRGRIGYGFAVAAMLSEVSGVADSLGLKTICTGTTIDFRAPVYIGDTLTYVGRVVAFHKSVNLMHIDVTVTSQLGELVATAELKVKIL